MLLDLMPALKAPGMSIAFSFEQAWPDLLGSDEQVIFTAPVKVSGTCVSTGEEFLLRGTIDARYTSQCARCLCPVQGTLNLPFEELYIRGEDNENNERYAFTGEILSLDRMVHDQIALNIPVKHLCREDCKGLCPQCGADRNREACSCLKEQ